MRKRSSRPGSRTEVGVDAVVQTEPMNQPAGGREVDPDLESLAFHRRPCPCGAAIEACYPERITAHVDYYIGHAWREVGKLVRELTPPSGNVVAPPNGILIPIDGVSV